MHGRAHVQTPQMNAKLLASLDPYNEAEYLELSVLDLDIQLVENGEYNGEW